MSNSIKKSDYHSNAGARSEKDDKKSWHRRFRKMESQSLRSSSPEELEAHIPVDERQVSNPRDMMKDGRHYFSEKSREKAANRIADFIGMDAAEKIAIREKLLHRWIAK